MSVYKRALQLLPKGLAVGMQVASRCYSVLLKTCKVAGGNLEPSSCKTQTLVELFQCMSGFDEPQFLDAVTAATVRYTDHKVNTSVCNIQHVSRLEDITAGDDFLGLCDQKSSYKHVFNFVRLRSYYRL